MRFKSVKLIAAVTTLLSIGRVGYSHHADGGLLAEIDESLWSGIGIVHCTATADGGAKLLYQIMIQHDINGFLPDTVWASNTNPALGDILCEEKSIELAGRPVVISVSDDGEVTSMIHVELNDIDSTIEAIKFLMDSGYSSFDYAVDRTLSIRDGNLKVGLMYEMRNFISVNPGNWTVDNETFGNLVESFASSDVEMQEPILYLVEQLMQSFPSQSLLDMISTSQILSSKVVDVVLAHSLNSDLMFLVQQSSSSNPMLRQGSLKARILLEYSDSEIGNQIQDLCNDSDINTRIEAIKVMPISQISSLEDCLAGSLSEPHVALRYSTIQKLSISPPPSQYLSLLFNHYHEEASSAIKNAIVETLLRDPFGNSEYLLMLLAEEPSNPMITSRLKLLGVSSSILQQAVNLAGNSGLAILPCGQYIGDLTITWNNIQVIGESLGANGVCPISCVVIYGNILVESEHVAISNIKSTSNILWKGHNGTGSCYSVEGLLASSGNSTSMSNFVCDKMTVTANANQFSFCNVSKDAQVSGNSNVIGCSVEGTLLDTGHANTILIQ